MRRVAAAILAVAIVVPVSEVFAAPDEISESVAALSGAQRLDNATPTDEPVPPTTTTTVAPAAGVSVEMQQVLDLANVERTSRGLVPLRFSEQLNAAALAHTRRQASAGSIFHTDPSTGSSPGDRISATGYRFSTWGENVAAGYRSPAAVMQGWMNSPGHCRNILNPAFNEIGVGYVTGGVGFGQFWTQVFARPADVPRPAGTYNAAWC